MVGLVGKVKRGVLSRKKSVYGAADGFVRWMLVLLGEWLG